MEMTFYDGDQFPAEYRGDIFATFHGSCTFVSTGSPAAMSASGRYMLGGDRMTAVPLEPLAADRLQGTASC